MPRKIFHAVIVATATTLASLSSAVAGDQDATTRSDTTLRAGSALQVASVAAIVPKNGIGTFARAFDCTGSITQQGAEGPRDTTVLFWLGVRDDHSVHGIITFVGATLDLSEVALSGRLEPYHDDGGHFLGGRMVLDWPFADRARTVDLELRRVADRRVDPKIDSDGMVKRRTGRQTYVAEGARFEPNGHSKLGSVDEGAVVTATCARTGRLSLATHRG